MIRRYEFVEGTSAKFWEIELKGEGFTARWGKLGTAGQSKSQEFESEAAALKAHDKLIAEKEKKGYLAVTESAAAPSEAKKAGASNEQMESAIAANPADETAWKVYADWLIEAGEPWGEVIAQAHAGHSQAGKEKEAQAELSGGTDGATFEWKRGVIDHFTLTPTEVDADNPMQEVLTRVLQHPAGHLVRKLTLGLPPFEDDGGLAWHMELPVKTLAAAGPLPLLEELDLSPTATHMDQVSWRRLGNIGGLWKAAPRLQTLILEGSRGSDDGTAVDFGTIDAPHLKKVVFQSGGLDAAAPEQLGAATLPKLEHLELQFGREDYGCTSTVASLAGILSGKGLPALKYLGLTNSEWETELIDAVAGSAILPRLHVVSFTMGTMMNDAFAALMKHAKKFAHLKSLELDDNYFTAEQIAQLKAVLPNASLEVQKELEDEDEAYRYTTVGE